jgi:hypothetical protein
MQLYTLILSFAYCFFVFIEIVRSFLVRTIDLLAGGDIIAK